MIVIREFISADGRNVEVIAHDSLCSALPDQASTHEHFYPGRSADEAMDEFFAFDEERDSIELCGCLE